MSSPPTSRQELYDRIRESSRDEVILEEMIRLGFWPRAGKVPNDPGEEIRRRGELERKLRELRAEASRLGNIDALKRDARKRRMAESRRKRKDNKERRLDERKQRAAAWRAKQQEEIGYLGTGVSAGLADESPDRGKLAHNRLPELATAREVAAAMAISVGELRFLAFSRKVSRKSHYVRFTIAKKSGGQRLISAPMQRLKQAQSWILANILAGLPLHDAAHGFRHQRSIVSNARPHVGAEVVVNLDLQDFFPTVSYPRVKGMFRQLGYGEAVATIFALLCTEPETVAVELDGETFYVAVGERFLPQGAPTSPAITNRICRRLDYRLTVAGERLGFCYTRYADDMSFSAASVSNVGKLLRQVAHIVGEEGFFLHPDKTRVLRKSRRQEVTGLVVNQGVSVPRQSMRRFRATLFQIEKDGPEGKHWGQCGDVIASVVGFANFVAMVDPDRGAALQKRTRKLAKKYGTKPPPPHGGKSEADAPAPSDEGENQQAKKKKWWQIF